MFNIAIVVGIAIEVPGAQRAVCVAPTGDFQMHMSYFTDAVHYPLALILLNIFFNAELCTSAVILDTSPVSLSIDSPLLT